MHLKLIKTSKSGEGSREPSPASFETSDDAQFYSANIIDSQYHEVIATYSSTEGGFYYSNLLILGYDESIEAWKEIYSDDGEQMIVDFTPIGVIKKDVNESQESLIVKEILSGSGLYTAAIVFRGTSGRNKGK